MTPVHVPSEITSRAIRRLLRLRPARAKMVRKGQEIFVQGALRQDRWTDKETGQNRSHLYAKADCWQFTQYRRQEEQSPEVVPTPEVDA